MIAIDHTISISKYNPLAGSSYIKLPKELDHPRKGLINIQNFDDIEFFKWCFVTYVNLSEHNPRRITNADKGFVKRLHFKDIKFPVKVRDIHKIEKKNSICISVSGYENKEKKFILCIKEILWRKTRRLIINSRRRKKHCVLIKDFYTFMYDYSLHCVRKHFCRYCLYALIREEILMRPFKDSLQINGKQWIAMPKKGEYVKFKNY